MKNFILLFTILIVSFNTKLYSQNLVPDPSFEMTNYIPCGLTNNQEFDEAMTYWKQGTFGSPDIYSTQNSINCQTHMPINNYLYGVFGSQSPRTGNTFIGITSYIEYNDNWREYITTTLTESMYPNTPYLIRFYISCADSVKYASNGLGIHLSTSNPTQYIYDYCLFPEEPQIRFDEIITNDIDWIEKSVLYFTEDTTNFITIGCFLDDNDISIISFNNQASESYAYYFIDDVSVSPVDIWVTGDSSICAGDTAVLYANGNDTVSWALSSNTTDFFANDTCIRVAPEQTTTYWLYGPRDTVPFTVYVSHVQPIFGEDTTICHHDYLYFDVSNNPGNYIWQDSLLQNNFTINEQGVYSLKIIDRNCVIHDTIKVSIDPGPIAYLGSDTSICSNDSILLNPSIKNATYIWNDNQTDTARYVFPPGTWWVDVSLNSCFNRDSITISTMPTPSIDLGSDTTLCPNDSLLLIASYPQSTYTWSTQTYDSCYMVTHTGAYFVTVSNVCGSDTDSINVKFVDLNVDLGDDSLYICNGDTLYLNAYCDSCSYLWHNTDSTANYNATQEGLKRVVVTKEYCSISDSVYVSLLELPVVYLGPDTSIYQNQSITLQAGVFESYLWNTNETGAQIEVIGNNHLPGIYNYWLQVNDEFYCSNSDTIQITIIEGSSGINENIEAVKIKVYPNPTINNITIEKNSTVNIQFKVYTDNGTIVRIGTLKNNLTQVKNLSPGTYYLQLKHNGLSESIKFVVK